MGGPGLVQHLAVEAADILKYGSLDDLPPLINLARFCRRLVWYKLVLSVCIKVIVLLAALALSGISTATSYHLCCSSLFSMV
ncbi:unnamed protein product [Vitrella brassicaformis CCMP3155]|uniref:Uncharacterized protein n=1 Tax=Vitrella brassicaformis (strain CCMP3155) TaxID=1169540 RepID=A0A0G4FTB2_VITBC|nr:unnamed protein product [Vitrella brassicaformis CCMP3155]|mmetsp:Transcript_29021/g.72361  ORF Transcript_29021/g.72361 Transcript_29021/m.72361 type:complete len:82 (-) Transcript_29021:246-491(-)|eukprot:CEM18007.1 unnamed protein product [Vitrella brassicaformis CCMP3155]